MTDEVLFHHGTTMVRRLRLAPGEAMPWHRDPFRRIAVALRGDVLSDALSIEYRDGGESQRIEITPGEVEWEEPTECVHRAVNVGEQTYKQVTGKQFISTFIQPVPQP
jgi:quercetin dioxygenase-like cupin family protein